eukprot:Skav210794  [mRNA]  locus=scaffold275:195491:196582:+ [translate_table: standard]
MLQLPFFAWLYLALPLNSQAALSCQGRCNLLQLRASCQCTASCVEAGSCCEDYVALCTTKWFEPAPVTIGNISLAATPSCPAFGPAEVTLDDMRSMILFLPPGLQKVPLWFVMHGTNQHAESFLSWTSLDKFAAQKGIALVALQGVRSPAYNDLIRFNVGRRSEPISSDAPDDVALVRSTLQAILKLPCIDRDRVHCTGYSNGGRFCSRLASEMSEDFASVAPVSGLRYPFDNNATRAVPILALHGDADPINPFGGHGGPYWDISVPDALQRWAKWNHCYWSSYEPMFVDLPRDVSVAEYDECNQGASVKVMKLKGAGHQWPGCENGIPGLGDVHPLDGHGMIYAFFDSKRLSGNVKQREYPI